MITNLRYFFNISVYLFVIESIKFLFFKLFLFFNIYIAFDIVELTILLKNSNASNLDE